MNDVIVALIGAAPATLAAAAAWRKVAALSKPLESVASRDSTLVQTVDQVAHTMGEVSERLARVEKRTEAHLAWHRRQDERDDNVTGMF